MDLAASSSGLRGALGALGEPDANAAAPAPAPAPAITPRFKPSVTVAAVIEQGGRYLIVEEHTPEGLRLNNPAGHLEQGESPLQAVQREALEETACVFTPDALVGVYLARFQRPASAEDVTYVRLAFCGRAGTAEPGRSLDEGIVRTLWLSLDELRACRARHRSPLVLQCVEDHARGRRFPLDVIYSDASLTAPLNFGELK